MTTAPKVVPQVTYKLYLFLRYVNLGSMKQFWNANDLFG